MNQLATPTLQRKESFTPLFVPALTAWLHINIARNRFFFPETNTHQVIQGPNRLPAYFTS